RLPLPRRALAAAWERGAGPAPRDADVVHAPTLLVPPRRRRPLVVTVHDTVPWTHPDTLTPHGARWHRAMGRRVARYADAVLVPTHAVAEDLRIYLGVGTDRLHVVGEGVSPAVATAPPDADERAARLGLPPGGYLLTLATFEPRKGLDVALAALADPAAPPLPLLVVGQPGWGGVDPAAQAARLGLPAGRVRVLGRLSDADLAVVLARARLLLVPSRSEGFGLPLLEAFTHGVPAVVSAVPALVEVGGDAVLHVPVGDPVALATTARTVVEDPALHDWLSAAARRRAAAFGWDATAEVCWSLYRALAGAPATSAGPIGPA
ncbi:MAG TPA: glycosyltransferase family 1 protein, partial [Frankiaceae bacterium]|nr:glycosyltransferase family 1 protein [Frankiaceae bacterium]